MTQPSLQRYTTPMRTLIAGLALLATSGSAGTGSTRAKVGGLSPGRGDLAMRRLENLA